MEAQLKMKYQNKEEVEELFNSIKYKFKKLYADGLELCAKEQENKVVSAKIFKGWKRKAEMHARAHSTLIENCMNEYQIAERQITTKHGRRKTGMFIGQYSIQAQVGYKLNAVKGNLCKKYVNTDKAVKIDSNNKSRNKNGNISIGTISGPFGQLTITANWNDNPAKKDNELLQKERDDLKKEIDDLKNRNDELESENKMLWKKAAKAANGDQP